MKSSHLNGQKHTCAFGELSMVCCTGVATSLTVTVLVTGVTMAIAATKVIVRDNFLISNMFVSPNVNVGVTVGQGGMVIR